MQKFVCIIKHLFSDEIVINRFLCTITIYSSIYFLINHDAKAIASLFCYFYHIMIIILKIYFLSKVFSISYQITFISIGIQFILYYILHHCTVRCLERKRKISVKNVIMIIWLTCNYSRLCITFGRPIFKTGV